MKLNARCYQHVAIPNGDSDVRKTSLFERFHHYAFPSTKVNKFQLFKCWVDVPLQNLQSSSLVVRFDHEPNFSKVLLLVS